MSTLYREFRRNPEIPQEIVPWVRTRKNGPIKAGPIIVSLEDTAKNPPKTINRRKYT